MVKAVARFKDGRRVLILGFSDINIQKLQEGRPIAFNFNDVVPETVTIDHVFIVWGHTEADILAELNQLA